MTRRSRTLVLAVFVTMVAASSLAFESVSQPAVHPSASAWAGLKPRAAGDLNAAVPLFALEVSRHKESLPADLAPPISAVLIAGDGVRVTVDKTTLDFWWVKGLPAKAGTGAASWSNVEEGTLVGAVRVPTDFRDLRGRIIKPGTYTLRYGIQPQDGDHLGISPFREFLLLSPAGIDKDVPPLGHDDTIEISKRTIGGSHPAVWSIDPPTADQAVLSLHKTDLGHDAVILEVPVQRDGTAAGTLKFGLVLVGRIEG
jgi:hypothetical protein